MQKIQHDTAFKMLKGMGYKVTDIKSKETTKMLSKMGFKVTGVKKNARAVSSYIGNNVDKSLQKRADEMGISKAALIRDVLYQFVNKKNKLL